MSVSLLVSKFNKKRKSHHTDLADNTDVGSDKISDKVSNEYWPTVLKPFNQAWKPKSPRSEWPPGFSPPQTLRMRLLSEAAVRYFYSTNAGGGPTTLSTIAGGTGGGQQTCPSGIPIQGGWMLKQEAYQQ